MARHPGRYGRRQLLMLQHRVRQWCVVVAKQLVYASAEQKEINEADLGDITPVSDDQRLKSFGNRDEATGQQNRLTRYGTIAYFIHKLQALSDIICPSA